MGNPLDITTNDVSSPSSASSNRVLTRRQRNQMAPIYTKPSPIVTIASWEQAEPYALIPFIKSGYRINHSLRDAVISWVTLHSDTVNIWTHFFGFCYFIWGFFHVWDDVAGITAMILGSNVVALHQGFHCQPLYMLIYVLILLCLLSIAGIMALQPGFQTTEWDFARNTSLSACVAFGAIPAYHWAVHCDFHCVHVVMWAMLGMFGNYFIGFCFFVARIPERWVPRTFDIWGSSHQIWHVFVVIAGVSWLHGILEFHRWRINHGAHCDATQGMELPIPYDNI